MKKLVALALSVVMAFCLVACGSSGPEGTYKLTKMSGEGMEFTGEMLEAMGMSITLELKSDGTGTISGSAMGEDESTNLTWEDGKITIDGETVEFKLDGDTLSMEQDGALMEFEK